MARKERILPREYQQKIADSILEKKKNSIIVLPTGTGKTLCGAMIIKNFLDKGEKAMFLAPTRPLVDQHKKRMKQYLGVDAVTLTGRISPKKRKEIYGEADLIIATPQCVEGESEIFVEGEGPVRIKDFIERLPLKKTKYRKKVGYCASINTRILGFKNKNISFVNAKKAWKLPSNSLVSIATDLNMKIICTPEHPLLSISPDGKVVWREAQSLEKECWIALAKKIDTPLKNENLIQYYNHNQLRVADKKLIEELHKKLKELKKVKLAPLFNYLKGTMPLDEFLSLASSHNLEIPNTLIVTDSRGRSSPIKLPFKITPKLAYILGAMLGDGHIDDREGHGGLIAFSDFDRSSVSQRFKRNVQKVFGIVPKHEKSKGLVIYSSALAEVLSSLGIPKGKKVAKIKVPKIIFSSSEDCVTSFLAGIFDTDGCAHSHSITFATTSRNFARDLQWLFLRLGIVTAQVQKKNNICKIHGREYKSKDLYIVRLSGAEQMKLFIKRCVPVKDKIRKSLEGLQNIKRRNTRSREVLPVPIALKEAYKEHRKNGGKTLDDVIRAYSQRMLSMDNLRRILPKLNSRKAKELEDLIDLPIRWVRVKKIEKQKRKVWTYDLTIPDGHSFVSNLLISHNTVANDLRKRNVLSDFKFILIDECHRAVKRYAYTYIAKRAKDMDILIVGLTASPGGKSEKIREIMEALSIDNVEIRTGREKDVTKYIQPLKIEWDYIDLDERLKTAVATLEDLRDTKIETLHAMNIKISKSTSRGRLSQIREELMKMRNWAALGHFATFYNAFHGIGLIETEGPYTYIQFVERLRQRKKRVDWRLIKAANMINDAEHPKIDELLKLVDARYGKRMIIFAQYRDQVNHIVDILKEKGFEARAFLGKREGTWDAQKKVIEGFAAGDFDILCCSSVHPEEFIVIRDDGNNAIKIEKIGDFVNSFTKSNPKTTASKKISGYSALSYDGKKVGFFPITHIHKHRRNSKVVEIRTASGLRTKVTENHSLFSFNSNGNLIPVKPEKNLFVKLALSAPNIEVEKEIDIVEELIKNAPKEVLKKIYVTLDNLTQARIRIFSTDKKFLSAINKKDQSVRGITEKTNLDQSAVIDSSKRLENKGFIKTVKKGKYRISSITETGTEYLSFLNWLFRSYYYKKWKYRIPLEKAIKAPISVNRYCKQFVEVSYGKTRIPRFIKPNEALAEFLGLYVSEGSTRKTKFTSDVFLAARNKKMQERMKKSIEEGIGLKTRTCWRGITIDAQIAYYLIKYVFRCGIGAYHKEIPDYLFSAPSEQKWKFLEGYCAGDGHVYKKWIRLTSVSQKLICGLILLLRQLNVKKISLMKSRKRTTYDLNIFASLKFQEVTETDGNKSYYNLIPRALSSDKAFTKFENKFARTPGLLKSRMKANPSEKNCFDLIKEIKPIENQPNFVYDISVKGTERFLGGLGLLCLHNSIGEEGIDIPAVDTAIFYEPIPSVIRTIQRRGRVGRTKGGEVIVLVTRGTIDETFRWVSLARERKMYKIIGEMKEGKVRKKKEDKKEKQKGKKEEKKKGKAFGIEEEQRKITDFFGGEET